MRASTTSQAPLKLFRADVSPYQAANYLNQERLELEKLGHQYLDSIDGADILITNTHTQLSRFSKEQLAQLKLVLHPNSGYDNFTPAQIMALPCPFLVGNRIRAKAVAMNALACLFDAIGMPPWQKTWDKTRQWQRRSLENMRIQIVGHGHIGRILEESLRPIAGHLDIYDPYKKYHSWHPDLADVIILACSLNQQNVHLVNHKLLEHLKSNLILINPARGKLINQFDLDGWLNDHPEAKAYLDVFEDEPYPIETLPSNCKGTSHVAGVDDNLDNRIIQFVIEATHDFTHLSKRDFTQKWESAMLAKRIIDQQFI